MATGTCVGWKENGFGFIRPDDGGADVFVHASALENAALLSQGQRVAFEIITDERRGKPRADLVKLLK